MKSIRLYIAVLCALNTMFFHAAPVSAMQSVDASASKANAASSDQQDKAQFSILSALESGHRTMHFRFISSNYQELNASQAVSELRSGREVTFSVPNLVPLRISIAKEFRDDDTVLHLHMKQDDLGIDTVISIDFNKSPEEIVTTVKDGLTVALQEADAKKLAEQDQIWEQGRTKYLARQVRGAIQIAAVVTMLTALLIARPKTKGGVILLGAVSATLWTVGFLADPDTVSAIQEKWRTLKTTALEQWKSMTERKEAPKAQPNP